MKNIHSVPKLLISLLGLALAVQSCIKEDMDDCDPNNVKIVIRTHTEPARSAAHPEIENATLYLFDNAGTFVEATEFDRYIPGQPYVAEFQLDPGLYKFVVWTNTGQSYTTNYTIEECYGQHPSIDDMELTFNYPANGIVTEDIPDMFFGINLRAEVKPNTNHEFPITLIPDSYRLNFVVEGLTPTASEYRFEVSDNNSHYNFDNSIIGGKDEFHYLRNTRFADNELTASMTVLRLLDDRTPRFDFIDITNGELLYSNNLVKIIRSAYSAGGQTVDFNKTFEFTITLRFDAQLNVSVSVDGWEYNPNETEL